MCHMVADTPEELLAMVERIGVEPRWFQHKASVPHFDVALSKRALAVAAGAIELERREFVEVFKKIRASWPRTAEGTWALPSQSP